MPIVFPGFTLQKMNGEKRWTLFAFTPPAQAAPAASGIKVTLQFFQYFPLVRNAGYASMLLRGQTGSCAGKAYDRAEFFFR